MCTSCATPSASPQRLSTGVVGFGGHAGTMYVSTLPLTLAQPAHNEWAYQHCSILSSPLSLSLPPCPPVLHRVVMSSMLAIVSCHLWASKAFDHHRQHLPFIRMHPPQCSLLDASVLSGGQQAPHASSCLAILLWDAHYRAH